MMDTEFTHQSEIFERQKRARLLLSGGFHADRAGGVCYLLHSFAGNRNSWLDHTPLATLARDLPLAFVMPECWRRWFIDDHEGKLYESYLLHELIPAVEKQLSIQPNLRRRFIGGFSAGGAAAVFIALRHPARFGAAFAHSGAFHAARRVGDPYRELRDRPGFLMPDEADHLAVWGPPGSPTRATYDPESILVEAERRGGPLPRLYLDLGLDDYPRVLGTVRAFRAQLLTRGFDHEYRELQGGHDWEFVGRALPGALDFLARCLHDTQLERRDERER